MSDTKHELTTGERLALTTAHRLALTPAGLTRAGLAKELGLSPESVRYWWDFILAHRDAASGERDFEVEEG